METPYISNELALSFVCHYRSTARFGDHRWRVVGKWEPGRKFAQGKGGSFDRYSNPRVPFGVPVPPEPCFNPKIDSWKKGFISFEKNPKWNYSPL